MIALIPMAGAGSRFTEAGYTIPKPLLPVLGKPMVVNAAEALPVSEKYCFIVRDFQINDYGINKHLNSYFPSSEICVIDHLTEGQAVTCLMAKNIINNDESLCIGASDNGMIYDRNAFHTASKACDALIFTFRNNPSVLEKPQAYGWVKSKQNGTVENVSVKIPLSNNPTKDHAVVGTFWFKKGSIFVEAAERMIAMNRRINNEFYVDECMNDLIDLGYIVKIFEIDHYVCWGTPNDFETFLYWESYYDKFSSQFRL